jgi:hypothetical protein
MQIHGGAWLAAADASRQMPTNVTRTPTDVNVSLRALNQSTVITGSIPGCRTRSHDDAAPA